MEVREEAEINAGGYGDSLLIAKGTTKQFYHEGLKGH